MARDNKLKKQIEKWHNADNHAAIIDALTQIDLSELGVQERGWLARAYNNVSDYESALTHLLAIESESQNDWIWHYRVGYAYDGLKQWRDAQRYFEHALSLNPGDEDCQFFIERCLEMRTLKARFEELHEWLAEYQRELAGEASEEEQQSILREGIDMLHPSLEFRRLGEYHLELISTDDEFAPILSRALEQDDTLAQDNQWRITSYSPLSSNYPQDINPTLTEKLNQIGVRRATLDVSTSEMEQAEVFVERLVAHLKEWGNRLFLGRVLNATNSLDNGVYRIELETYDHREYIYFMAMIPEREDWFVDMGAEEYITMTVNLYNPHEDATYPIYPIEPIEDNDAQEDEIIPQYMYSEEEITAIEAHIDKHFGKSEFVLHEVVSPDIHLDLYLIEPTPERPYYTIVTGGMGAYKMNVPDKLLEYKLQRAELVICLPPDWEIQNDKEKYYWPLRLLKFIGRLPIHDNKWLGWGHSIGNLSPYDSSVSFTGCMLVNPVGSEGASACELPSGDKVNFYQIIPLYEEEMQYKISEGAESLLSLMQHISHVINPKRPCAVPRGGEKPLASKKVFS